jgi:hypothetical protein
MQISSGFIRKIPLGSMVLLGKLGLLNMNLITSFINQFLVPQKLVDWWHDFYTWTLENCHTFPSYSAIVQSLKFYKLNYNQYFKLQN